MVFKGCLQAVAAQGRISALEGGGDHPGHANFAANQRAGAGSSLDAVNGNGLICWRQNSEAQLVVCAHGWRCVDLVCGKAQRDFLTSGQGLIGSQDQAHAAKPL